MLTNKSTHVVSLYALSDYLSNPQITAVESVVSAWTSMLYTSLQIPYCSDNKVLQKLKEHFNVEPFSKNDARWSVQDGMTPKSTLAVDVPSGKKGYTKLVFSVPLHAFAYGDMRDGMAAFGVIYCDVTAGGSSQSNIMVGGVTFARAAAFCREMEALGEQAVRDAYDKVWGDDANYIMKYIQDHADGIAKVIIDELMKRSTRSTEPSPTACLRCWSMPLRRASDAKSDEQDIRTVYAKKEVVKGHKTKSTEKQRTGEMRASQTAAGPDIGGELSTPLESRV